MEKQSAPVSLFQTRISLQKKSDKQSFIDIQAETAVDYATSPSMADNLYKQICQTEPERVFNNLDLYRLEFPMTIGNDNTQILSAGEFDVNPGFTAVWDILSVNNTSLVEWMTVQGTLAVKSLPFDFAGSPIRTMIKNSPGRVVSFYTHPQHVGTDLPPGMLEYLVENTNAKICIYTIYECIVSKCGKFAATMSEVQNFCDKIEISYQELQQIF